MHTGINPFLLGLLSPKSVRVRNIWDSYRNGQGWVHRRFIPACPANSLTMTAKKKVPFLVEGSLTRKRALESSLVEVHSRLRAMSDF